MINKSIVPNGLTSMNLLFGVCSILATFADCITGAAVCVLLSMVADGLDGRAARALGVSSEMGKEMDSLCDCVSFGVAPAIIAYSISLNQYGIFGIVVTLFFALCGMLRLARFNVNTDVVHGYFMGLAIPAGGCLIATSTLMFDGIGFDVRNLGIIYPVIVAIVGYLMVSGVHYPDFKSAGDPINKKAKLIAGVVFVLILLVGHSALHWAVLFGIFAAYTIFGIANHSINKAQKRY